MRKFKKAAAALGLLGSILTSSLLANTNSLLGSLLQQFGLLPQVAHAAAIPPSAMASFTRQVVDQNPPRTTLEKAIGDIDGDGRMDAVIGFGNPNGSSSGQGLAWYEFPHSGNPADPWLKHVILANGISYEDAEVYDINGDGAPDVVSGQSGPLYWFENPKGHGGNPATDPWTPHLVGNAVNGEENFMAFADLDGDGKTDIATGGAIYFQNSPTSWTQVVIPGYSSGMALLDIGSGKGAINIASTGLDVTQAWFENPRETGGNARTGTWIEHVFDASNYGCRANPSSCSDPDVSHLTAGDLNGDGRMDLVSVQAEGDLVDGSGNTTRPPGGLVWWQAPTDRRNGAWIKHTIDATYQDAHNSVIADMNKDGLPDIITAQQEQSDQDRVSVFYNDGAGNFTEQVLSNGSGHNLAVADMNGDGTLDILNAPHGFYGVPNPVEVYFNNGVGTSTGAGPAITIWYGDNQPFGQNGQPQQWINILGTVTDPSGVKSLTYSLNGAAAKPLTMGPEAQDRLVGAGDFNADIDYSLFHAGANSVLITAINNNNAISTHAVNVIYAPNSNPPQSYSINWAAAPTIQSVAQVVDGKFATQTDGTLRTTQVGYDRLVALGDMNTWKDYTVTTDMTLHASSFSQFSLGVLVGWRGHTLDQYGSPANEQPYTGHPFPGWGDYSYVASGNSTEGIYENTDQHIETMLLATNRTLPFETKEMVKFQVKQISATQSQFSSKIWPAGTTEPAGWDVQTNGDLSQGSVLLAAHQADVSWGNVTVTPGALPALSAPVFSPAAGTYQDSVSVSMSAAAGTAIHYTLDGSAPTASSPTYAAPITIGTTTTVKAYATESGFADSPAASSQYSIFTVAQLSAPTIAPNGGSFTTSTSVTLSADPGASIYYTTDGSTPSSQGTTAWYAAGGTWLYRSKVTLDHTKVAGAGIANFPVLVATTSASLKPSSNGGKVGKADATDVVFTSSDGVTKLSHEIEKYNPATGEIETWVKVPALSNTADTVLYMYYGNASAADQQNKAGVWDASYAGVWHMGENAASTAVNDSTSNGNNGANQANTSAKTAAGKIDGALAYNGTSDYTAVAAKASLNITSNGTVCAWIDPSSWGSASAYSTFVSKNGNYVFRKDVSSNPPGDNIMFAYWDSASVKFASVPKPSAGAWHFACAVVANNAISGMYVDGALLSSASTAWFSSGRDTSQALFIGDHVDHIGKFAGMIDETEISTTNRSAAWIATEYSNQNSPASFAAIGAASTQSQFGGANLYSAPFTVSTTTTVKAIAASGSQTSSVSSAVFTISSIPSVTKPVMSPNGGTFVGSTTVGIASDAGATIRYTLDGTAPNGSSPVFVSALTISTTTTVEAYATKSGFADSAVATASYVITAVPTVSAPAFAPNGGSFVGTTSVSITSDSGAAIHYTQNGTTPTSASPLYSGAISVASSETIKAFAMKSGFQDSPVSSASFTITAQAVSTPSISPNGGSFTSTTTVSLSSDAGATIYYTLNGATPTTASAAYSAPFALATTTTVKAIAAKSGFSTSAVASALFTISISHSGVSAPIISPNGGSFTTSTSVTLSADPGASIYYTTDGSTPSSQGTTAWYAAGGTWLYRSKVTLDHTKVAGAGIANFPVLVATTSASLKPSSNGGKVGKADATDVVFTSSDGVTKLSHEIEKYNPATGEIETWVKVPALSNTADTVLYMYYGNASAADQQNKAGVWDANYKAVWHLGTAASPALDSTSNARSMAQTGGVTFNAPGKIGSALSFNGATQYLSGSDSGLPAAKTPRTITLWYNAAANAVQMIGYGTAATNQAFGPQIDGSSFISNEGWANDFETTLKPALNSWHFFAITFDGTTATIYSDNAAPQSLNESSWNTVLSGTAYLGINVNKIYNAMKGLVDEVEFSSSVRSAAWIATEYSNQNSPASFAIMDAPAGQLGATTLYVSPFSLTSSATVKAMAISGGLQSPLSSAVFTKN